MTLAEQESPRSRSLLLRHLVETAPPFLGRNSSPRILQFNQESHLESLDSGGNTEQITHDVELKLKAAVQHKRILSIHIPAAFLLKHAFDAPKPFFDDQGTWYTDMVTSFVDNITHLRYGKRNDAPRSPAWAFQFEASFWKKKMFNLIEYNQAWEIGCIIDHSPGQTNNLTIITLSLPWERSHHPWYKSLSSDRGFVGRGFTRFKGEPVPLDEVARIFNQTQEQVWWGEATQANRVEAWGANDSRKQNNQQRKRKPNFSEIVIDQLNQQLVKHKNYQLILHNIRQSEAIYGYMVRAFFEPYQPIDKIRYALYPTNWAQKS